MAKRLRKGTQPGKCKSNQEIKMKATKRNSTNPPEWLKCDRLTSAGCRATDSFIPCWWEAITGKATGKQFGIICQC